jgi:ATP-binding cassette subfamily B protein
MEIIRLENVSFNYPNYDKKVLDDVSITLEEGKTYALIGPTGEGKSTIASIISGLLEPTNGSIFLWNKDLKTYSNSDLASQIGYILQDPYLFSGTILDNIVHGNLLYQDISSVFNDNIDDIKIEEFEKVLEQYNLTQLISSFEDGLKTQVSNSSDNISLGQKQIISFIRAVLRSPKLLILDEATANLDTITENTLQKIIESLPNHTTKLIIAHRLNTVKNADIIFEVGGGKIQVGEK